MIDMIYDDPHGDNDEYSDSEISDAFKKINLIRLYIWCQYLIAFPVVPSSNLRTKDNIIRKLKLELLTTNTIPFYLKRIQDLLDSLKYNYPLMKKTKKVLHQQIMEYVYHPNRVSTLLI